MNKVFLNIQNEVQKKSRCSHMDVVKKGQVKFHSIKLETKQLRHMNSPS